MSSCSDTNIDRVISSELKVCFFLERRCLLMEVYPTTYVIVIIFNFFSINFLIQTSGTSNNTPKCGTYSAIFLLIC